MCLSWQLCKLASEVITSVIDLEYQYFTVCGFLGSQISVVDQKIYDLHTGCSYAILLANVVARSRRHQVHCEKLPQTHDGSPGFWFRVIQLPDIRILATCGRCVIMIPKSLLDPFMV